MTNVSKTLGLTLLASVLSVAMPAQSADLGSLLDSASSLSGSDSSGISSDLLGSLTSQLGVTDSQAAGGTAALMALAQQQLSSSDGSLLDSIIPSGASDSMSTQLLNQITNMESVQQAFGALGLDASMVQQFAPIIMQYLGDNGGADLLGSLTKIWA
ncbi:DUF2780 domain-containing protein [Agarivorans sp. MS3-6]|uniref:DUF2780 domain-containing protein n=1 Tax=Agarivorans sp. TSD2052 TaxID=2937286 RepID=UPI0020105195|nr:DUF2780 domain-containing protein [Agarivorans sp. TSD2052]UPW20351.1 DUF2780 domain-containing protein [Agarivorans sp. TSD2052]